ncbi:MAG: hypothetical protein AB7G87_03375 [Clostridia bacterium]
MFNNHIQQTQSNIQTSYIIKSTINLEKYVSKKSDGNYYLSTLTKVQPFSSKQEAQRVAEILNGNNEQVEILEIQNRTMW